jgi:protein-disulfide isomerase
MFSDQQNLEVPALKQKAVGLKLNSEAFDQCLDSGKHAVAVRKDIQEGARVGVTGTPAMFINGRFFSGTLPFEDIARVIDEELKRAEKQNK